MEEYFEDFDMEMPTPCQHCNKVFDLTDGYASYKWFPNTVICESCSKEEEKEIENDEEIQELKEKIDDAQDTIKEARRRLAELGVDIPSKVNTPNY